MDKELTLTDSEELSFQDKHRFMLMIILSIFVASVLVAISMALYYSSGAAQLDLSRPGYKDVRAQVINNDDFQNYSNSGPINKTTIAEFESIYSQQVKKTESVDAFAGDPLSPDALGINVTTVQ